MTVVSSTNKSKRYIIFFDVTKTYRFLRVSKIRMIGIKSTGQKGGLASFRVFFENGTKQNYSTTDLTTIKKIQNSIAEIEWWDEQ